MNSNNSANSDSSTSALTSEGASQTKQSSTGNQQEAKTQGQTQTGRYNQQGGYRRNQQSNRQGQGNRQSNNRGFVGDTKGMNGHVFQVHAEQKKRGQFQDTLDMLKIYASTAFKKDITSLNILFSELKEPRIPEPEEPKAVVIKTEDGKEIRGITKFG